LSSFFQTRLKQPYFAGLVCKRAPAMVCAHTCITLQHNVTQCNTLQHMLIRAAHLNILICCANSEALPNPPPHTPPLQHTATHCNTLIRAEHLKKMVTWRNIFKMHCLTRLRAHPNCNNVQRTATHCNALQRTATHCNTHSPALQRTATHCNTHSPALSISQIW